MKYTLIAWLCYALFAGQLQGQNLDNTSRKICQASNVSSEKIPTIDGKLDDEIWKNIKWQTGFIQNAPNPGEAASQKTEFGILYDEKNLYFAAKCYDTNPEQIVRRLSRHDGFEGDRITILLDSYHDLQTAFAFTISAAGVRGDEITSADGQQWDVSWTPIWAGKTSLNEEGWFAEVKIPLSQLRFGNDEEQIWGLQCSRFYFRNGERSDWQFIPQDAPGFVSQFGELIGLKNIKPQKQFEIQPYLLSKLVRDNKASDHPFKQNKPVFVAGLDAKIGITNDMTLDLTLNPDFGQVEADPAAINLDGFQVFFREQRPFFIENKNIFDYGLSRSMAGNTFYNDNLFYSRRIGKSPSGYPSLGYNEIADQPINTTILGAAKFSGKTKNGLSVGILESVTNREYAAIDNSGERRDELVEPLTNYFVARVKKDFNNRNSQIGGIFTSTNRKIEGNLDFLHRSAVTGGIDYEHRWKNRSWYVAGNMVMSNVQGSTNAITNTQKSIGHLFQREDADHLDLDTTKTSLTGTGGHIKLGKSGNGRLIFEGGLAWRSPELELNDIGFQRLSDDIRQFAWAGYRWLEPFSVFRRIQINVNFWNAFDFSGKHNLTATNINSHFNYKNNWYTGFGMGYTPVNYSASELRGGPRFRRIPRLAIYHNGQSNYTKKLVVDWGLDYTIANEKAELFKRVGLGIRWQPTNALSIRLGSEYWTTTNKLQYVTNITNNDSTQYILANIDRNTLNFSLRMNYTINPTLTLQYYGAPYVTRANYSDYKYVTNATSKNINQKVKSFHSEQVYLDSDLDSYLFDKNYDGTTDFEIANPDFTFVQFRSNLVLRWEYRPGSEFYLVWSVNNSGNGDPSSNLSNSLNEHMFKGFGEHTFLAKATYRFLK